MRVPALVRRGIPVHRLPRTEVVVDVLRPRRAGLNGDAANGHLDLADHKISVAGAAGAVARKICAAVGKSSRGADPPRAVFIVRTSVSFAGFFVSATSTAKVPCARVYTTFSVDSTAVISLSGNGAASAVARARRRGD